MNNYMMAVREFMRLLDCKSNTELWKGYEVVYVFVADVDNDSHLVFVVDTDIPHDKYELISGARNLINADYNIDAKVLPHVAAANDYDYTNNRRKIKEIEILKSWDMVINGMNESIIPMISIPMIKCLRERLWKNEKLIEELTS